MKLNVGSGVPRGQYKRDEWVNVDFHKIKRTIQADMTSLPFPDNTFEEIHAIHCFEHVKRPNQLPVLRELHRVLEPGGVLYLEVPNFKQVVRNLVEYWDTGNVQMAHNMTASLYGKQRYEGDAHHWGFTDKTIRKMLFEAGGWDKVTFPSEMISNHYLQEPVLLVKATKYRI